MSQEKFSIHNIVKISPIIPSVELLDEFDAVPLIDALKEGGVKIVEVFLRTRAAYESIEAIKKIIPDIIIGAANIKTAESLKMAIEAGADYGTSPGSTNQLLETVTQHNLPFMPGSANGSDIMRALEYGFSIQKFSPAVALGGVKTLKYLQGHFHEVQFCPAGGLNEENLGDFLSLSNVSCVTGTWIVRAHDVYEKRWNKVTERTKFSFDRAAQVKH